MMTRFVALTAIALFSTAFAAPPVSPIIKAKQIIAKRMIDPSSLVVRNTKTVSATINGRAVSVLCGEYNSKNRFGGYVGFKQFIYDPRSLKGVLVFGNDLQIDFFSESGSGDFNHDPEKAVRAGVSGDVLEAAHKKYTEHAIAYLPECLGLS